MDKLDPSYSLYVKWKNDKPICLSFLKTILNEGGLCYSKI